MSADSKHEPAKQTAFPSAAEDVEASALVVDSPQTRSSSYRLAYTDQEFLLQDALRPVRLQLELLKPELIQQELGITSTVVIFGSARIPEETEARQRLEEAKGQAQRHPDDAVVRRQLKVAERIVAKCQYYSEARRLAAMITAAAQSSDQCDLVVITGGGPGIMEAANRGAGDAQGKSIGLSIVLPFEQRPNDYITPELSFQFHYFAIRKMHFLMRAKALVAFPGGFGTLDELFETLTLVQTQKIKPVPVLLFGKEFWDRVIDFEALAEEGTIDFDDLQLFRYVDTAEQAWEAIKTFNHL